MKQLESKDKETPKSLIHDYLIDYVAMCPNCNQVLTKTFLREWIRYCPFCGQALNYWDEEFEEGEINYDQTGKFDE